MSRNLNVEVEDHCGQLTRYGSPDVKIVDVLGELTDINDDMAHGRSASCIEKSVTDAKRLLDEILIEYKKTHS